MSASAIMMGTIGRDSMSLRLGGKQYVRISVKVVKSINTLIPYHKGDHIRCPLSGFQPKAAQSTLPEFKILVW